MGGILTHIAMSNREVVFGKTLPVATRPERSNPLNESNRDFSPIIDLRVRFGLYEREHNNDDTGNNTHKDRELDVVILEGSCARYTE
jgi:hypothetical protein